MHKLQRIIKDVNKTHKGLGQMVGMEILTAKARKTLLKVAPAGCGKSAVSDAVSMMLYGENKKFTSITLAGLMRLKESFSGYSGHIIIDDLGAEKSMWSRISTITVLANLVHTHFVHKVTHSGEVKIEDFQGSVSLNIQPVILNSLVQSDEWISVVRDKVMRYYHLNRPINPTVKAPYVEVVKTTPIENVKMAEYRGKLWYDLVAITLNQWSYARVLEHVPDLLKACAVIDGRTKVKITDYRILIKILQPMQLEPYLVDTYGFESGRVFNNNLYCILVELATFGNPTVQQICYDYKVSRSTADRLIERESKWCFIKGGKNRRLMPTDKTKELLEIAGVDTKW